MPINLKPTGPEFDGEDTTSSRTPPQLNDKVLAGQEADTATTITVGTVGADGQSAFLQTGNNSFIGDYQIRNSYEKDGHIYMMGVTSPVGFNGNSVAFCQLSAPTLLWICDWTCMQIGTFPAIPNSIPLSASFGWYLLDEHYEPGMIMVAPDGVNPLYRISGTFVYGNINPNPSTIVNIRFSRPPWLKDAFQKTMPAGNVVRGLTGLDY